MAANAFKVERERERERKAFLFFPQKEKGRLFFLWVRCWCQDPRHHSDYINLCSVSELIAECYILGMPNGLCQQGPSVEPGEYEGEERMSGDSLNMLLLNREETFLPFVIPFLRHYLICITICENPFVCKVHTIRMGVCGL